jgi:hypothetical protein
LQSNPHSLSLQPQRPFGRPDQQSQQADDAVSAGYYHSPGWGQNYPKIQVLTIAELLRGVEVKMPPAFGTFKQAQRVAQPEADQGRLDL